MKYVDTFYEEEIKEGLTAEDIEGVDLTDAKQKVFDSCELDVNAEECEIEIQSFMDQDDTSLAPYQTESEERSGEETEDPV